MTARLTNYLPYLYLSGLVLIVIGLPLGKFFMSLGIFMLLFTWIFDAVLDRFRFDKKFYKFFKSISMVLLVVIYLIHIVGLVYTSNIDYALADLRIKLPFLVLPVIIAGMKPIKMSGFHFVMKAFILAVFVSSLISLVNIINTNPKDIRDGVMFVSHIRLSLMVVLGISYIILSWYREQGFWKMFYLVFPLWSLFFLWRIEAVTGLGILLFVMLNITIFQLVKFKKLKSFGIIFIVLGISLGVFFLKNFNEFFTPKESLMGQPSLSAGGEIYANIEGDTQLENGYYINHFVAHNELSLGWEEVSSIPIDGKDYLGQPLKSTLIRYMTSKGLKKDHQGISNLNSEDVSNIENGITNYKLPNQWGLTKRINALFFEWNAYKNGANPSSNSVMMRLEFWKTGILIIKQNPLFGVGTGDITDEMNLEYERSNSILEKTYRKRVHNQFLAFAISFGLLGLIAILFCLLWPYFKGFGNKYAILFAIIFLLSFLTEDTLETQAGSTFVAFFSCFFLKLHPKN